MQLDRLSEECVLGNPAIVQASIAASNQAAVGRLPPLVTDSTSI